MIKRRCAYQALHNENDVALVQVGWHTKTSLSDMKWLRKLRVILWKNWLFRKRQYIMTFFEILLPTLFSVLLMVLRNVGTDTFKVVYHENFTTYKPKIVGFDVPGVGSEAVLLFTPELNVTRSLLLKLEDQFTIRGVESEKEMEDLVLNDTSSSIFAGITFLNFVNESLPSKFHYRIRLPNTKDYETGLLAPQFPMPGPVRLKGLYESFVVMQNDIALRFIELMSGFDVWKINITTQRYPYPPYYQDNGFSEFMQNMLPTFIILSYVFISPTLIKYVVREKEMGVKELMKLMGLPGWIQWTGWFVSSFVMMTLSAAIIVLFLCARIQEYPVLSHSSPSLIFFILILYIMSAIVFCFFISCFFSKPTIATAIGVVVWMLSYSVPFNLMSSKYNQLHLSHKMLVSLLPNMAMAWAMRFVVAFEGRSTGIQWYNLNEPSYQGDNLTMAYILVMFVVDIILYGGATWYLDNVFPGIYGVGKSWNFIFTKDYWLSNRLHPTDEMEMPTPNNLNFEKEPTGLDIAVGIRNLSKSYTKGKMAVDNLSLNIFEGQITALLGHNGAGKTTTMSILTGMFSPTSGTAIVNGYDIRTNIEFARENLGLCPQHNMLFNTLTAEEHLYFFGMLKMNSGKELKTEVTSVLQRLQLWDKRNTLANNLSGGMKRKLNLGIALIGKPKIVMLDEPTSGMDPEARRAIWDMLQELRTNHCIILSTHFMEEADVLGDRIAIMAQGQIECCGSPLFLKRRYGAGYHLNISKGDHCDVDAICSLIQESIPGTAVKSNSGAELCLILPSDSADKFAGMFKHLEKKMDVFGMNNFGICVTTMEEVFLKVGETVRDGGENGSLRKSDDSLARYGEGEDGGSSLLVPVAGVKLWLEQIFALILKRWYYTKRRWVLLIAQILLPVFMIGTVLYINNKIDETPQSLPSLTMDLSAYGPTTVFERNLGTYNSSFYASFPKNTAFRPLKEAPMDFLKELSIKHFEEYSKDYIVGADFTKSVDAWFNGQFYHTQPLTLNLIHNTIAKFLTKTDNISLTVDNAPLEVKKDNDMTISEAIRMVKMIMLGIFLPIGLSFLSSSFIVFPIHERATKSKHLQLMSGVGGTLFWGASFVWDFTTHLVCSLILMVLFATIDESGTFTGDNSGVVFLLLMLYGWCSIPFTYMVSFMAKLPATGFSRLTIVNFLAGMILSVLVTFFMLSDSESLQNVAKSLAWIFRFLPNYTITVAFMNLVFATSVGKVTIIFKPKLFKWNWPGIGQEITMLVLTGFFYFALLAAIERGLFYSLWYRIRRRRQRTVEGVGTAGNLDEDVAAEMERVHNQSVIDSDVMVVCNLRKEFSNFAAVDNLSFGVHPAECFGLLGINGAGKTTTFQMLTGDLVINDGDAYLNGFSLRNNRVQFLNQIGYCPQFDALIDYLTGRETLTIFAHLRGISGARVKPTVDRFISNFDLTEHADKITMHYSGGNKRKLSAALGFIGDPPIVFLDEPTTGVDPVARRKIWDILTGANSKGISVVLTSHSMEECEVLCNRVGIMVNGQFQCLGPIQHLKNKFSQGFTILAKLKSNVDHNLQNDLQQFIQFRFPSAALQDIHQGLVHYHVKDVSTKWAYLFESMEEAKARFNLEDYSVSQATLEQVFLSFARKQRVVATADA